MSRVCCPSNCCPLLVAFLLRLKGSPHPGNTFLGCFDDLGIVLFEGKFYRGRAPFGVDGETYVVKHFEAFELRVFKAALPVVLNGHAFAFVNAAGNGDSLRSEIQPFFKIRIKLTAGANRSRRPVSFGQLTLRIAQSAVRGSGDCED